MVTDDAQLEGCGVSVSSTPSVFAAAGASRARGAGRPVGRRRLTGTSRSCQCHTHAPVLQLLQMAYRGAYSRNGKAELLRYSRT